MSHELINQFTKASLKKKVHDLKSGMTVRVHQKINEGGKERVQMFEGVILQIGPGYGVSKTVTVRKIVDGIGVEKIFPIHAPSVERIEVVKVGKVRRSKLYFLRDRSGKSSKLYEKHGEAAKHKIMEDAEPLQVETVEKEQTVA